MTKETLRELYVEELKDIFSAENQLTKALPKMAKAASSEELREGFEDTSSRQRCTSSVSNRCSKCSRSRQAAKSVWAWKA